jgi:Na+-translocating ferredoxin:NAD+ oxidoreductase RNF subunit RnfB
MEILLAAAALGALGLVLATLLAVGQRFLAVAEDPRLAAVRARLPGNDCGACGYPGCAGLARALLAGEASPSACTVATPAQRAALAALLGTAVGEAVRRVARLACAGGANVARVHGHYLGERSCAAAATVAGAGKGCAWGCLGFGDCERSCDFDAIAMDRQGLPEVDPAACVACGDCVTACPRDLFELVPEHLRVHVACRNPLAGDAILEECRVACTACARCAFDAPASIRMVDGLPVLARERPPPREAIDRCPTGAIVWLDDAGHAHRGRAAPRVVRQQPLPVA